ncbi:MAG: FecR domain-containing protein, partial [Chthoniobacterales bacterium]
SVVIHDVRLLPSKAAPRPAIVNDNLRQGTAIRTGAESRTELTFADETITRLGQNTVFSFRGGSRQVQLESGALLIEVPQGGPAAQILTPAVTAGITGGTGLLSSHKGYPTKWLILEGVGQFCTKVGDCVTLHAGEMALEMNGHLTGPFKFDVKLVYETAHLIADFPPLPNEALILQVIDQQEKETGGQPPPPPLGKDELDLNDLRASASPTPAETPSPTASPSGTPSKYGRPSTITSPDPYVISSGTTIQTDPTITTNGVTNNGTIYRSMTLDGSPTEFLFGEPETPFDQLVFTGGLSNQIAVFKFSDLQLTGTPTVTVPPDSPTRLAFAAVGDITSAGPGGTWSIPGVDRVSFITQHGSITLGPEIAFDGFDHVEFYARGTGSNLTLGSAITNVNVAKLDAEGTIQVNGDETVTEFGAIAGVNFLAGSGVITA